MANINTPLTVTEVAQFIGEVLPFTMDSLTRRALRAALEARRDVRMYRVHHTSSEPEHGNGHVDTASDEVEPNASSERPNDTEESEDEEEVWRPARDSPTLTPSPPSSPPREVEGYPVNANTAFYCPNTKEGVIELRRIIDLTSSPPSSDTTLPSSSPSLPHSAPHEYIVDASSTTPLPRGYRGLPVEPNTTFYCRHAEEAVEDLRQYSQTGQGLDWDSSSSYRTASSPSSSSPSDSNRTLSPISSPTPAAPAKAAAVNPRLIPWPLPCTRASSAPAVPRAQGTQSNVRGILKQRTESSSTASARHVNRHVRFATEFLGPTGSLKRRRDEHSDLEDDAIPRRSRRTSV